MDTYCSHGPSPILLLVLFGVLEGKSSKPWQGDTESEIRTLAHAGSQFKIRLCSDGMDVACALCAFLFQLIFRRILMGIYRSNLFSNPPNVTQYVPEIWIQLRENNVVYEHGVEVWREEKEGRK